MISQRADFTSCQSSSFEGELKKGLSNDAKVLYSLLKDRHELSLQNNWVNEKNEVYLIYTRGNMQKILGLSDKTVKKAIDQLKKFGLMEEERVEAEPSESHLFIGCNPLETEDTEIFRFRIRRISDSGHGIISESRTGETPIHDTEKFRPNDTDTNNTDFNHIYPSEAGGGWDVM